MHGSSAASTVCALKEANVSAPMMAVMVARNPSFAFDNDPLRKSRFDG
jgi:hypothetical protein